MGSRKSWVGDKNFFRTEQEKSCYPRSKVEFGLDPRVYPRVKKISLLSNNLDPFSSTIEKYSHGWSSVLWVKLAWVGLRPQKAKSTKVDRGSPRTFKEKKSGDPEKIFQTEQEKIPTPRLKVEFGLEPRGYRIKNVSLLSNNLDPFSSIPKKYSRGFSESTKVGGVP